MLDENPFAIPRHSLGALALRFKRWAESSGIRREYRWGPEIADESYNTVEELLADFRASELPTGIAAEENPQRLGRTWTNTSGCGSKPLGYLFGVGKATPL